MKKIGGIKADKEAVTYDQLVDPQRLERRQRDGEVSAANASAETHGTLRMR